MYRDNISSKEPMNKRVAPFGFGYPKAQTALMEKNCNVFLMIKGYKTWST